MKSETFQSVCSPNFYRIFDKYGKRITAIAIYTGNNKRQPDTFTYDFYGTKIIYQFNTFSILQLSEQALAESDNPFVLVVLASQYQIKTKKNFEKRYGFKKKLIALAAEKQYDRYKIAALLRFIHFIVTLPENFEAKIKVDFVKLLTNDETHMELTKRETMLADIVHEAIYGEIPKDRDKKIEEATKAQVMAEKVLITQRLLKLGTLTTDQIAIAADIPVSVVNTVRQEMEKE